MASFITVAALKAYTGHPDSADDDLFQDASETAAQAIRDWCGRDFTDAGSATARYPEVTDPYCLDVSDFHTTTGLVVKSDEDGDGVYETTWATTDYELAPLDGVVDGTAGWPYMQIYAVGSYRFPLPSRLRRAAVEVTARWGWAAVPEPVRQACLQVASEEFRRKDAPFGIADSAFGPIRMSADAVRAVEGKLRKYRSMKSWAGVA